MEQVLFEGNTFFFWNTFQGEDRKKNWYAEDCPLMKERLFHTFRTPLPGEWAVLVQISTSTSARALGVTCLFWLLPFIRPLRNTCSFARTSTCVHYYTHEHSNFPERIKQNPHWWALWFARVNLLQRSCWSWLSTPWTVPSRNDYFLITRWRTLLRRAPGGIFTFI